MIFNKFMASWPSRIRLNATALDAIATHTIILKWKIVLLFRSELIEEIVNLDKIVTNLEMEKEKERFSSTDTNNELREVVERMGKEIAALKRENSELKSENSKLLEKGATWVETLELLVRLLLFSLFAMMIRDEKQYSVFLTCDNCLEQFETRWILRREDVKLIWTLV